MRLRGLSAGQPGPRGYAAYPEARMTDEELRRRAHAWVERHAIQQGVPGKISDPLTLRIVADILQAQREKSRRT